MIDDKPIYTELDAETAQAEADEKELADTVASELEERPLAELRREVRDLEAAYEDEGAEWADRLSEASEALTRREANE